MMKLCTVVPLLVLAGAASAAELPFGLVEKAEKDAVQVRFDAAARLAYGQMVALYGPGSLTKHPLTGKVVTERRKLLAKGQVVAIADGLTRLRILWRDGDAVPESGWDAVPLPGESAPNAPPVLTAPIATVTTAAGALATIKLPISDPDGDALSYTWELIGTAGRRGRLDARTTAQPEATWIAPGSAPEGGIALKVTVRDPLGQELTASVPLQVQGADDPRRPRKPFAAIGAGQEPAWSRLERSDDGGWIGVDDGGRVLRCGPGWQQAVVVAGSDVIRRPIAVAARGREIFILDGDKQAVQVFTEAGQPRRVLGGLAQPSDLAVAADGTVYVADQRSGGIMVFDAGGRFRARAGRVGDDGFAQLDRVCATADGGVCALDGQARRIHRFDRDLRRLDTWTVTGDPNVAVVDLASHPRGLLVLLADGSVQLYGTKGTIAETWKAATAANLADDAGAAVAIASEPGGEIVVLYARGVAARQAGDGKVLGVRGPTLPRSTTAWAADGAGRLIGLEVDYGMLNVHDAEGWRTHRFGGRARSGGPFSEAGAIAVAPDGSGLAVLDVDKDTLVRFDGRDWRKAPLVFGGNGTNNGQFKAPIAVAMDEAGRSYVLDEDLYRVSVFDAAGQFLFAFGERGTAPHQFDEPVLIAVSPTGDSAYVFDEDRYEVKKFSLDQQARSAKHVATAGGKGSEPGRFRDAVAMLADRQGLLHILDASRSDWQVLDFRGQSLLPLAARPVAEILRGATTLAVSPDGTAWLGGAGALVGVR